MDPELSQATERRADELFRAHQQRLHRHTDHLFAGLMVLQWLAGIAAAYWISPRAWSGTMSWPHLHLRAAVYLGGAISLFPVLLALFRPGHLSTRLVIAVGQGLTSALLIHLTGGRIETHFHVFGSIAFLSFYRDWRVLAPITLVVSLDHLLRGLYWPESVYGVLSASGWRWFEHTGWLLFEDVFVIASCRRGVREMRSIATRQAQLETANALVERGKLAELRSRFVSMASHEFRTPLTTILAACQSLVRYIDRMSLEQRLDRLAKIEAEVQHMTGLLDDVLTIGKADAGKLDFEPARVDLKRLCEEIVAEAQMTAAATQRLVLACAEDLTSVTVDPKLVRRILGNLLTNAAKYSPMDATVSCQVAVRDGQPVFEVRDQGIGIPPEDQARLFEPFHRGTNVGKIPGSGLGLAITKKAVEIHGGTIAVESIVGKGTTFVVRLGCPEGARE
jgi:signal transduction histidine kinase